MIDGRGARLGVVTGCTLLRRRIRSELEYRSPIKFGEDFGPLPRAEVIPLKEVK